MCRGAGLLRATHTPILGVIGSSNPIRTTSNPQKANSCALSLAHMKGWLQLNQQARTSRAHARNKSYSPWRLGTSLRFHNKAQPMPAANRTLQLGGVLLSCRINRTTSTNPSTNHTLLAVQHRRAQNKDKPLSGTNRIPVSST